jgi:peroxiredoxin Q/BCP
MAEKLKVGDRAPDFRLKADDGREVSLADFRGRWLVLYFFPKALTPG